MAAKPVKKIVKTSGKPKVAASAAKPKAVAKPKTSTAAKPKSAPNLKKGGLAPASQQVKIRQLKSELKNAIDSDWSTNHPIKAHKLMRKAEKELGTIYKKLGYNKVGAEDFNYNSYPTNGNKIGKRSESWRG